MASRNSPLLDEIEAFIAEAQMGESYFGKKSAGNSELVARLRGGGRVWPETEAKVRSFILMRREMARHKSRGRKIGHVQEVASAKGSRERTARASA
tara:strand:+ start:749 stop:1036 length:288 start_codon:yes stop_codon:yes gene_type:complete